MERTDHHLLSAAEVAKAIGHSQGSLRRMIRDGEFPNGFPAPKQLKWKWGVVRGWIDKHEWLAEMRATANIPEQSGTSGKETAERASKQEKPR